MKIVNQDIKHIKSDLHKSIGELLELTQKINHKGLEKTVEDLKIQLDEPFMFVIVGEVKAGKSSFINALLETEKDICKVAPSPMTDTIQQIVYGEKEREEIINQFTKKIYHPSPILKEIAIVDTPGTNTIIDHHQEITTSFIPSSDLIVFVFEAKNPYRQSAWDFYNYIHEEWRRKIIFVLQQKDLMDESDLKINIKGVEDQAIKKGIPSPKVFAVSAKLELEGSKTESGFQAVREFITNNITGGKAPFLKMINISETGKKVNEKIFSAVRDRMNQLEADKIFRREIGETLEAQGEKSVRQVDVLVENLLAGYDTITRKKELELSAELSFFTMMKRSFGSLFTKQASLKVRLDQFVKELEYDMNNSLKDKLQNGVIDIADSIQQMAKMVDFKIRSSETILKDNHEIFSAIAERRANVLKELQQAFAQFLGRTENFYDDALIESAGSLGPNVAAGGGVAIVGVILTTITNTIVFDITGGVLATIGLLFAGVTIGLKKKKIMKGFRLEVEKGRLKIENEVSEKLSDYISRIKRRIQMNFDPFDIHLQREEKELNDLQDLYNKVNGQLEETLQVLKR